MTGLVFSALARVPDLQVSLLVAVPFLAWSLDRLLRTHRHWTNPVVRVADRHHRGGLAHADR